MIKVLFFASLREQLGCGSLDVAPDNIATLAELRETLSARGENWQQALSNSALQVALNQQIASMDSALASGDEVAFFPPVTGG